MPAREGRFAPGFGPRAGRGHTRLGRLMFGSTAEKVILAVRSPILAYRTSGE